MLTPEQFKHLFPRCKDPEGWVQQMENNFDTYHINTPERIASFIAQCGHESGGWKTFSENLNYSAKALNAVFPKYFKRAGRDANEYARKPEKIANVVYANRMGNGPTESGDGWLYRGRGPIQITGHDNYETFGYDMGVDVRDPDDVANNKEVSLLSALWFWNKNDLNKYADNHDIKGQTRNINGGYNGLKDRINHYEEILDMMTNDITRTNINDDSYEVDYEPFGVIKRGSRGEGVKLVQELLGIPADGIFGLGTEHAVIIWQTENGLYPDGIVGPKTFAKMLDD